MTQNFNSRKSEDFQVGGKVYKSLSWSPLTAAKKLPKIGQVFAVPISFLFSNAEDPASAIPQALMMLFSQLEEQDVSELFNIILTDVWCKTTDKPINIETDLDNLDELLQLGAMVLTQHYGALISGNGMRQLFKVLLPVHQMV